MDMRTSHILFFIFTVGIIMGCMTIMFSFGLDIEHQKVKNMLISGAVALFVQQVIAEPLQYIVMSIDQAFWPPSEKYEYRKVSEEELKEKVNKLNFLKQRVKKLKLESMITESHRDTELNNEYRGLIKELFNYLRYFFVMFMLVIFSRDEQRYHNTKFAQRLFLKNHSQYYGLEEVYHLNQLFDFVESSLVSAFNYDPAYVSMSPWVHSQATKMLGVVRMRQLRLVKEQIGWGDPEFADVKYMPNWVLPYANLYYTDKYWRAFDPFIPLTVGLDFLDTVLLNFNHIGRFQNYPELMGYVALLARAKVNTMKILDYLEQATWLTYNTSAVFFDFALLNADVPMFTVCTLRVERTPFGTLIPDASCDSCRLLYELDLEHYVVLLVICLFVVCVVQFIQTFVVHIWYEPQKMRSLWFILDFLIIVLSIVFIILVTFQTILVREKMYALGSAYKLQFVDFRHATRLESLLTIVMGFLICFITLRLCKVMQFAKVFRLFTKTLEIAQGPVAGTAVVIGIMLMAFAVSLYLILGNNSVHFVDLVTCIASTMCFAFGFTTEISPGALLHTGRFLGLIMYAILGFLFKLILINLFISIIYASFLAARAQRDEQSEGKISFVQFLRIEYDNLFSLIDSLPCCYRGYKRKRRTVAENILRKMEVVDKNENVKRRLERAAALRTQYKEKPKSEETLQGEYREKVELLFSVSEILNTQFKMLELIIFGDEEDATTV